MAAPTTPTTTLVVEPVQNPIELLFEKVNSFWKFDLGGIFGDEVYDESSPVPAGFPAVFVYSAKDVTNKVGVRESPALDAPRTGKVIEPGEKFGVDHVTKISGVRFAKLSSGGYVSMTHPRTGAVLITRETPLISNQGPIGMMDVRGITKACKDLSAEVIASQYWRESAMIQLDLLDLEAKNREDELSRCVNELSACWGLVTEGNAPPNLINHVGSIDSSADKELSKVKKLRNAMLEVFHESKDSETDPMVRVKSSDVETIATELLQLSHELRKLKSLNTLSNTQSKAKELLESLTETQSKVSLMLVESRVKQYQIVQSEVNKDDDNDKDKNEEKVKVKEEISDAAAVSESELIIEDAPIDEQEDNEEKGELLYGKEQKEEVPQQEEVKPLKQPIEKESENIEKKNSVNEEQANAVSNTKHEEESSKIAPVYNSDSDAEGGFEDF